MYIRSVLLHKCIFIEEVWSPGSADTVCRRRRLMTQVQHWIKTAQTENVILRRLPLTLHIVAPFVKYDVRCVSSDGPGDL